MPGRRAAWIWIPTSSWSSAICAATSCGWSWPTLFLLGAYHGINPGMGWLFAVALGMQEKRSWAVVRSLAPITLGHALAIGVVIGLAGLARIVVPLNYLKLTVAAGLILLGVYRI